MPPLDALAAYINSGNNFNQTSYSNTWQYQLLKPMQNKRFNEK